MGSGPLLPICSALARQRTKRGRDPSEANETAGHDLEVASSELRALARGIHPAALTELGLKSALEGVVDRLGIPAELKVTETGDRPKLTAEGARTRARIVQAVAGLIHERGVAATTLEDVKVAAEVSDSHLPGTELSNSESPLAWLHGQRNE